MVTLDIALPDVDFQTSGLIHVKLAAISLGLSAQELTRCAEEAGISPFDEDHFSLDDFAILRLFRAAKPRTQKTRGKSKPKGPATKIVIVNGEIYISITTAALLLDVKFATFWKWVVYDHLLKHIPHHHGVQVKVAEVIELKTTDLFAQKRYSYTEIGRRYNVSRQSVASWKTQGQIETVLGPGGQSYVLESELPKCEALAKIAQQFNRRPA